MAAALNAPDVRVHGVLDGLETSDIPSHTLGNYPLKTRMATGEEVMTDCQFLQPRLQSLIDSEEETSVMHIVLSVAPFRSLHAEGILIQPRLSKTMRTARNSQPYTIVFLAQFFELANGILL